MTGRANEMASAMNAAKGVRKPLRNGRLQGHGEEASDKFRINGVTDPRTLQLPPDNARHDDVCFRWRESQRMVGSRVLMWERAWHA